jgi:histidinol dehydrogenase
MKVFFYPEKSAWPAILERPVMDSSAVDSKVIPVIADVRDNGDRALVKYTEAFDGVRLTAIEVGQDIIRSAGEKIDKSLKAAIDIAVSNIEKFHMAQVSESRKIETSPGVICWQRSVPLKG